MQNIRYLDKKAIVFIQSTLFIVLLGSLTAFDPLSIDMYLPAFPAIQKDLSTDYSMVQISSRPPAPKTLEPNSSLMFNECLGAE